MLRQPIHDPQKPLLIFGGPYSNEQAMVALINKARELGLPAGNCICTGDAVAYGADPLSTATSLMKFSSLGCQVVMGNCEESLATGASDCGCGFEAGSSCAVESESWFAFASKRVEPSHKQWMGNLPRQINMEWGGAKITFIHGGVDQINKFIFASMPDEVFAREFAKTDADIIVGGHCGVPFARQIGDKLWINAGVIGMPANDGTSDGWYALATPDRDSLKFSLHRLAYDYERAARRMEEEHLSNGYTDALRSGLWPCLDVMPKAEKQMTGKRLEVAAVRWSRQHADEEIAANS